MHDAIFGIFVTIPFGLCINYRHKKEQTRYLLLVRDYPSWYLHVPSLVNKNEKLYIWYMNGNCIDKCRFYLDIRKSCWSEHESTLLLWVQRDLKQVWTHARTGTTFQRLSLFTWVQKSCRIQWTSWNWSCGFCLRGQPQNSNQHLEFLLSWNRCKRARLQFCEYGDTRKRGQGAKSTRQQNDTRSLILEKLSI